jgi:signal transduction histidine kinase
MNELEDVKGIWENILTYVGYFFGLGIFLGIFDPAPQQIAWLPYFQVVVGIGMGLVVWFRRFVTASTLAYCVIFVIVSSAILILRRYGTPAFATFHILTLFLVAALILPKVQAIVMGVACTTLIITLPMIMGWAILDATYIRWSVYSYLGASIYCLLIISFRERINGLIHQEATMRNNARKFFFNMAREMETPISSLKIINEGLVSRNLPGDLGDLIKVSDDTVNHLDHMVSEIVDVTNLQTSSLFLAEEPLDLNVLMYQLMSDFEHKLKSKSLQYHLDLSIPKDLLFTTDGLRLKKLLSVLLSNAVNFTHHGVIKVSCKVEMDHSNVANATFVIADTGIGIPLSQQQNVFKPFVRIAASDGPETNSVGLGLNVAKKIVNAFGGTMTLTSEPDKGTQVVVALKLNYTHNIPSDNPDQVDRTDLKKPLLLKGRNILLLASRMNAVTQFSTMIQLHGANVKHAVSVDDLPDNGLLWADIILLSLIDDKDEAFEQALFLRDLNYQNPLLALVEGEFSRDISSALAAGMNGYVSLNSEPQSQLERIDGCLKAFGIGRYGHLRVVS